MTDREFIKKFAKISISNICKKLKLNISNIYNLKNDNDKTKLLREEIESEYAKLYIKED